MTRYEEITEDLNGEVLPGLKHVTYTPVEDLLAEQEAERQHRIATHPDPGPTRDLDAVYP